MEGVDTASGETCVMDVDQPPMATGHRLGCNGSLEGSTHSGQKVGRPPGGSRWVKGSIASGYEGAGHNNAASDHQSGPGGAGVCVEMKSKHRAKRGACETPAQKFFIPALKPGIRCSNPSQHAHRGQPGSASIGQSRR